MAQAHGGVCGHTAGNNFGRDCPPNTTPFGEDLTGSRDKGQFTLFYELLRLNGTQKYSVPVHRPGARCCSTARWRLRRARPLCVSCAELPLPKFCGPGEACRGRRSAGA